MSTSAACAGAFTVSSPPLTVARAEGGESLRSAQLAKRENVIESEREAHLHAPSRSASSTSAILIFPFAPSLPTPPPLWPSHLSSVPESRRLFACRTHARTVLLRLFASMSLLHASRGAFLSLTPLAHPLFYTSVFVAAVAIAVSGSNDKPRRTRAAHPLLFPVHA